MIDVILTSCIVPNTNIQVASTHPGVRMTEVLGTLIKICSSEIVELGKISIYLVDSSITEKYINILNDVVKIIVKEKVNISIIHSLPSKSDIDLIKLKGKGFSEMLMLQEVLPNISNGMVLKLSGRYCPSNVDDFLLLAQQKVTDNSNVKCFCEKSNILKRAYTAWILIDLHLLSDFLEFAIPIVNDSKGYYMEHAFFDFLKKTNAPVNKLGAFHFFDHIISGSTGKRKSVIHSKLRNILYN